MDLRGLRQRCDVISRAVDLPTPFDLAAFRDRLAAARGRTITLLPMTTGTAGNRPCGMWVATEDADYVFFEEATSPLHRGHIVLHEFGHMLCGHASSQLDEAELASLLLPDLDAAMVRRVLTRTSYTRVEEQEAEMTATLILQRAGRSNRAASTTAPEERAVLERLGSTLGHNHHTAP